MSVFQYTTELATYQVGQRHHPVMVLLHGVTDSAASLADAIRHFQPHFHVIACDLRGHGFSPRFSTAMLHDPMAAMVDDVRTLLRSLRDDGRKIILCGHSMGGAIAGEVVYRDATLADALILEDPAWLDEAEQARYRKDGMALVARIEAMRRQPLSAMETLATDYPAWSWTEISAWYQAKCLVDLAFVATGVVSTATPYTHYIHRLNVPTLLLSGDKGALLHPTKCAEIRAAANPALTHVIIPSGGHCLRRDAADAFYAQVDDWLKRHYFIASE